jgi:hypothetical protein
MLVQKFLRVVDSSNDVITEMRIKNGKESNY